MQNILGKKVIRALTDLGTTVLPFHRDFIRNAFADDIEIAALSCARGSAKTWLAGHLAGLALRPGSPLWRRRIETLVVSASLEQSRIMMQFIREALQDVEDDYSWLNSGQRMAITHKATDTRLRVLSSDGRRAMGLSQFGMILADEPAAWQVRGGQLMYDALRQSLGKLPQQRLILIGTRSPSEPGEFWPELLDAGSGPGTHIKVMTAPADDPWDDYRTIAAVNPMVRHNPALRKTILRERDDARRNSSLRPAFEGYRLNRQVGIYQDELIKADDWVNVESRDVPPRDGRPILGIDLGSERSWSGAWAIWDNGRSECWALCPGLPDLATREKADAQRKGLYTKLQSDGYLIVDEGVSVGRPAVLIDHLVDQDINPSLIYCDTFMFGHIKDAVAGRWKLIPRRTRWSEATEDISGFRQLTKDGPLSIAPECRSLARVALGQASIVADDQGSVRLKKKKHDRSRDDVAVAATIAVGALARKLRKPERPAWVYRGKG